MIYRRRLHLLFVVTALLVHGVLIAFGSCRNSPARDEVAHLTAGLSHLELRTFDLYRVNPPLVRILAAIPTALSSAKRDWSQYDGGHFDRPEFLVGSNFISNNKEQAFVYFKYGRLVCIPFSILAGWICYRWSKELFGPEAGLIAVTLWCFLPEAIANGQLLTPDSAATSLGLVFCYTLWHWQRRPSWIGAVGVGVSLGIALLSKTTWLVAYPLLLIITLIWVHAPEATIPWKQRWSQVAAIFLLSVYVINMGYLFEGSGTRLGDFPFVSSTLSGEKAQIAGNRFSDGWLGKIPIPLPRNFVLGIDVQKYEFDEREYDSYLRGEWRQKGWWHYYLYAIAIKTPLGHLAMLLLAAITLKQRTSLPLADLASLLLPGIAILGLVSSQTGFNHHLRYVLPAMPYLLIFASSAVAFTSKLVGTWKPQLIVALACWSGVSCLFCFPHNQSYFNELVGGPFHGPEHLLNSNVDWGQDVHRVRNWLNNNAKATPLQFIPYCNYDIHAIDAEADWIRPQNLRELGQASGWFAISVNHLHGVSGQYSALRELEPVDFVGYSTYIYHVPNSNSPDCEHSGGNSYARRH